MSLDVQAIRSHFPALNRPAEDGTLPVFFDNPAGTQVPQQVIDAVTDYYVTMNANHGGRSPPAPPDAMVRARASASPIFCKRRARKSRSSAPNMTTLSFALSRALG